MESTGKEFEGKNRFWREETLLERIWSNVVLPKGEGCWKWRGPKSSSGYGKVRFNGNFIAAHRVAYELLVGGIPKGACVKHKCGNRTCMNPKHLYITAKRED